MTIVTKEIYDLKADADIVIKATITGTEITSSFNVLVAILPIKRIVAEAREDITVAPPVIDLVSISPTGVITIEFSSPILVFDDPEEAFM